MHIDGATRGRARLPRRNLRRDVAPRRPLHPSPIRRGPVTIATKRFIDPAHRAGLPVHVWTVNDEATIEQLLELGVDGIMSDRLRLLREVFVRRGPPLQSG
ncbi:MAG: glycerophosphodiester phosphodiesterase family protein [Solirubrobacteraceae bacterium]